MHIIDPNGCYTKKDATEALGVSSSTLQRYFSQGLKVRRPRGKIHILGCDLLEFLKADHAEAEAPVMTSKLENSISKAVLDIRKGKRAQVQDAAHR